MTDMIERVARAIKAACALPGTKPVARLSDVDRRAARAAIEAMRECELVVRNDDGHVVHELRGAPNDIWQHMITAALSQQEKN